MGCKGAVWWAAHRARGARRVPRERGDGGEVAAETWRRRRGGGGGGGGGWRGGGALMHEVIPQSTAKSTANEWRRGVRRWSPHGTRGLAARVAERVAAGDPREDAGGRGRKPAAGAPRSPKGVLAPTGVSALRVGTQGVRVLCWGAAVQQKQRRCVLLHCTQHALACLVSAVSLCVSGAGAWLSSRTQRAV